MTYNIRVRKTNNMTYQEIIDCTDYRTLALEASKLRPFLSMSHGKKLTEAQGKYEFCKAKSQRLQAEERMQAQIKREQQ